MREEVESRLRALARRAGWSSAPPAVVAAGLALACVAVAVALWRWWPNASVGGEPDAARAQDAGAVTATSRTTTRTNSHSGGASSAADTASGEATVCIDVVGAVRHPGVYVLGSGARVGQAVDAAGGALGAAATDAINLAAKVTDGEQIVVPTRDQVAKGDVPIAGGSSGTADVAGAGGATGTQAKIDLNTADATQLDALPGVGPSTAAKIVADRQANGPFKSTDDLGRVPGIGPKKLDTLKDLIVVR